MRTTKILIRAIMLAGLIGGALLAPGLAKAGTADISYNANGGAVIASGDCDGAGALTDTYNVGQLVTVSSDCFTRSGYTLMGYADMDAEADAGTVEYPVGSEFVVDAAKTLYAVWAGSVRFEANHASASCTTLFQMATVNTNLTGETCSYAGYDFVEWDTVANGSGTAYSNAALWTFAGADTLYAQWVDENTITYNNHNDGNTGNLGDDVTGTDAVDCDGSESTYEGACVDQHPTRHGHTFNGWFAAASGGVEAYHLAGASEYPSADVTYHAQWTLNAPVSLDAGAVTWTGKVKYNPGTVISVAALSWIAANETVERQMYHCNVRSYSEPDTSSVTGCVAVGSAVTGNSADDAFTYTIQLADRNTHVRWRYKVTNSVGTEYRWTISTAHVK